ncbi:MAG: hypothetical protein DRQ88_08410 [Epsilonproteobacteria bacterium]|nr:MAG: hypothetical protein DRQ89_10875 [Campylobacterota bacterium]RLA65951.1 MAG: hypothetical protein DRQ88_08410 [Campylobacterota bacterium]
MNDFSMGYFHSNEKGYLRKFSLDEGTVEEVILDLENLENPDLAAAYISSEVSSEDILTSLKLENEIYPIGKDSLTLEEFQNLGQDEAWERTKKLVESWSLRNNLKLVENFHPEITELRELIHKNWTSFIESFWSLLRSTLGSRELTIIFSDLDDNKKLKIVKKKAFGSRTPEFSDLEEVDKSILERYGKFQVKDHCFPHIDLEKGEIVGLGKIANCKVIWMAKVYGITPLQKSLLMGIFKALN